MAAPRITIELADRGVRVTHKRVGRLMREAGINPRWYKVIVDPEISRCEFISVKNPINFNLTNFLYCSLIIKIRSYNAVVHIAISDANIYK
ncbi:IS3 family transposase [uncultured Nitrosomonas sp.]|uniref:IS3 family transposase n=1 Tax=uncultured Nitrosomonas sp. TaxID=156424 RepID=UPI00345A86E5